MALKCKLRAFLSPKGLQDVILIEGTKSKFPREVEIKVYSDSRLGNWIIKQFMTKRKLILVDIDILGW